MSRNESDEKLLNTPFEENLSINPKYKSFLRKTAPERKCNYQYLHLTCRVNKHGALIEWIIHRGIPYEVIPNVFLDDDTVNIRIKIDPITTQSLDVLFLATKCKNSYAIYNIPLEHYLSIMNIQIEQKNRLNFFFSPLKDAQNKICYNIITELKTAYQLKNDQQLYDALFLPLTKLFYFGIDRYLNSTSYFYLPTEDGEVEPIKNPFADKTYIQEYESSILAEMKDAGISTSKWVNEFEMFIIIQKQYPDAIYQYRAAWLGKQSLDVFVPSLKIGFEYQGIQHFQPVDHFGGDMGFAEVQRRDQLKKITCENNGIEIIYWLYDEPVNLKVLKKKLDGFYKNT